MKRTKQIAAIICVMILAGIYILTFVFALTDNTATMTMFKGCVACTIFVPLIAYGLVSLHKIAMQRSKRKDYYSPSSDAGTASSEDRSE